MHTRAIETRYKGYRFRSRLEARWAVFFDALGLKWEYEPEGFELPGGVRYLPDFRLKTTWGDVYVEVKAGPGTKEVDWEKAKTLSLSHYVLLLAGPPDFGRADTLCGPDDTDEFKEGWLYWRAPAIEYKSCHAHLTPSGVWVCTAWSSGYCEHCAGSTARYDTAVAAARSARFEHGENGTRR